MLNMSTVSSIACFVTTGIGYLCKSVPYDLWYNQLICCNNRTKRSHHKKAACLMLLWVSKTNNFSVRPFVQMVVYCVKKDYHHMTIWNMCLLNDYLFEGDFQMTFKKRGSQISVLIFLQEMIIWEMCLSKLWDFLTRILLHSLVAIPWYILA